MKAKLTNYRQSPRKVRLVANAMKGKTIAQAEVELSYMAKRAAEPMKKLILSAAANATTLGLDVAKLVIKNVEVNKGLVMKRYMPRAMGVAKPVRHRLSHVEVTLGEAVPKVKKVSKKSK
jgi:large subunit ribosomal protein L22